MLRAFATLTAVALLAAAPSPAPSPNATARTLTVVCQRAPLYVFLSGVDRPVRGHTPPATSGERFALVSGPRTTLESVQYYETDIRVVDPGYPPDAHYWISRDCAIPS